MKVIIYGLGRNYERLTKNGKLNIRPNDVIVAYVDKEANERSKQYNTEVISPNMITDIEYDCILVTISKFDIVKIELILQGIPALKIISMELYWKIGKELLCETTLDNKRKRVLLYNENLGFHGSAIACYNVALLLKNKGFQVDFACDFYANDFFELLYKGGFGVICLREYQVLTGVPIGLFKQYTLLIANTLLSANIAYAAYKVIPIIWWIHEAEDFGTKKTYENIKRNVALFEQFDDWVRNIRIVAVSKQAANSFQKYFFIRIPIISLGIEDRGRNRYLKTKKIIFATIGYLREDKNQLDFLKAAHDIVGESVEFQVIGSSICDKEYYNQIIDIAKLDKRIILLDEIGYGDLLEKYDGMDIVVCPSYIESLSLTIIEGMMNSKIVITTDGTGIADYIEDGVNGFICKAGDVESLREKMQYVIDHFYELDYMRENARKTYEKYFTLEVLGQNLEREIKEAEKLYFNNR